MSWGIGVLTARWNSPNATLIITYATQEMHLVSESPFDLSG